MILYKEIGYCFSPVGSDNVNSILCLTRFVVPGISMRTSRKESHSDSSVCCCSGVIRSAKLTSFTDSELSEEVESLSEDLLYRFY